MKDLSPETPTALPPHTRVLVVDDTEETRLALTYFLELSGAEVFQAGNAADAISMTEKLNPSAILLDMQLPDGDGLEVAQRLRAAKYQGAILALTGDTSANIAAECLNSGCTAYLPKPVDGNAVVRRLVSCLKF